MIEIVGLSKEYTNKNRNLIALNNVNLLLEEKGLVCIIGRSGSGKTTLLNLISSMDFPTYGTIQYNKKDIFTKYKYFYRKNILSMVLQEDFYFSDLNSYENIESFRKLQNIDSNYEAIDKLIIESEIKEEKDRYLYQLSSGQLQRISILRSIYKKCRVILADEPTANLDINTEKIMFDLLKKASKDRLVVIVTHNKILAGKLGDRIIELDHGEIINDEKIDDKDRVSGIKIDNGSIIVTNQKHAYIEDWEKIQAYLYKNKIVKLILKEKSNLKEEKKLKKKNLVTMNNDLGEKNIYTNKSILKEYFKKSYKRVIKPTIWYVLSICILISIFYISVSISLIDEPNLIYDTYKVNDFSEINYVLRDEDSDEILSVPNIFAETIAEDYTSEVSKLINTKTTVINPTLVNDINEYYDDFTVYGFRLCNETNVNVINGSFPMAHEVLITDYLADMYIKYDNDIMVYDELLDKEVIIGNREMIISGIISTDFAKYNNIRNMEITEDSTTLIRDLDNDKYNQYLRFYINEDISGVYENLNVIYNLSFNEEIFSANIFNIDLIDETISIVSQWSEDEDGIYISSSLYSVLVNDIIETENNKLIVINEHTFVVNGIVEDFEVLECEIYAEERIFVDLISAYYSTDEIIVSDYDLNTINYLFNNGFDHMTYLSNSVNEVLSFSEIISNLVVIIVFICLVTIVLLIVGYINTLYFKYRTETLLLRIQGLTDIEILGFYLLPILYFLIIFVIISFVFIELLIFFINKWITKSFSVVINYVSFKPFGFLMMIVIVLLFLTLFLFVINMYTTRKKIIEEKNKIKI